MRDFPLFLILIITVCASSLFGSQEALLLINDFFKIAHHSAADNLVVVSCSGKSGSTTLEASFAAIGVETHRCHKIQDEMYAFIMAQEPIRNIIFIDSTRDIISRKIASFFQNLTTHLNLPAKNILALYNSNKKELLKNIQRIFKEKIVSLEDYAAYESWNRFHYNCLTDQPFDFNKKYQLKQVGNLYFVNLRFDDIKNWEAIIKTINLPLDLSQFRIIATNQSKDKWYKNIYKDFLDNFTLTKTEFNAILSDASEELVHFYTNKEIEAFIKKWKPYIK